MKMMRRLLWLTMCVCLFIVFLPYIGILNDPVMVGFLPMPLAVTLACNVILTACVAAIYPLYFKPFITALRDKPITEEKYHG